MALTEKQRKRILADYVRMENYAAAAKKNKCSPNTVKRIVAADPKLAEKCEAKKRACARDVLAYMDEQRETVCQIIGNGLQVLADPEKLKNAKPAEITTALGTLIDKWTLGRTAAPEPVTVTLEGKMKEYGK